MWYFILYVIVAIIWIACVNRYYEDHKDCSIDFDDFSDEEALLFAGIVWPLAIISLLIAGLVYVIYKGIYYVVDKIYRKIFSNTRNKTKKYPKNI